MYTQIYEPFVNNLDTFIPLMPVPKKQSPSPIIFKKPDNEYLVSESDYWNKFYHDELIRYEWNNGILELKDMPTHISIICANFLLECIQQYLKYNPIATLITHDHAFSINIENTKRIRRPDYAIILKSNPIQMQPDDYSYAGTYDICIELLSDTKREYVTKNTVLRKIEYANAKVSEYYIIDISNQTHTVFYRLDLHGNFVEIEPNNGVIQSTVLPGFQFREEDIYRHPDPNDLIDDDVYKHYMRLDLQKERRERENALREKENERIAKEIALREKENERIAKENALREKDNERIAKENALREKENERIAKENALEEIKRLKHLLSRESL